MKFLTKLSVKYSKSTLAIIALITIVFGIIIFNKIDVETDLTKSLPRELEEVQYDHLRKKMFSSKDNIFIGIENAGNSIFNKETLRYIDNIINEIKDLSMQKSYYSIITGKEEIVKIDSEIIDDDILSIINAQFVTTENNSIKTGSYTKLAREQSGLIKENEDKNKELPQSDEELDKFIPYLKKNILNDTDYSGNIISEDGKSTAILIPLEKSIERKKSLLISELKYMVDVKDLTDRFRGMETDFPHNIYNKNINNIMVNDDFIQETVSKNKYEIKEYFISIFKFLNKHFPSFYNELSIKEVDQQYIDNVIHMIERNEIYEITGSRETYENIINIIYEFMLSEIDVFSKDNLESKVYDLDNIYEVYPIYNKIKDITEKDKTEDIKVYIAGNPVTQAMVGNLVQSDLIIFIVASISIIILILFLSFRTLRGVLIPLSTVLITTIWILGFMLLIGQKLTSTTIALPVMLIAIGSAYCIHYLTRYYEDITNHHDKSLSILETTKHINIPIIMAGITTIGGFASLISANFWDVKFLGIMSSMGIFVTLILTFSYLPAVLNIIRKPKNQLYRDPADIENSKGSFLDKIMNIMGKFVYNHSKIVFIISIVIGVIFLFGIFNIYPESGMLSMFYQDSELAVADKFINKNLSGTGEMPLIIQSRDEVLLTSNEIREKIKRKANEFINEYESFLKIYSVLNEYDFINDYFTLQMTKDIEDIQSNQNSLKNRIRIMNDILNEEYEVIEENDPDKSLPDINTGTEENILEDLDSIDNLSEDMGSDVDSIDSLSDELTDSNDDTGSGFLDNLSEDLNSEETINDFDVSESQMKGINEILTRIGIEDEELQEKGINYILKIRSMKDSDEGKKLIGKLKALSDIFVTDFTQPEILRKLNDLESYLNHLDEPKPDIEGDRLKPVGVAMGISRTVKSIYKVFYHNDKEGFNKIPDVENDGFEDKSITDRNIVAVCLSQARSSDSDSFKQFLTDDMKESQFLITIKSDRSKFTEHLSNIVINKANELFPKDDPYIKDVILSGRIAIELEMNERLIRSQMIAVPLAIITVLIICSFILRSFIGGIISVIPLTITVSIILGLFGFLDIALKQGSLLISSIAIGAGIDYTIHFLQRYKNEHLMNMRGFRNAYLVTLHTTGKAIIFNAFSVAGGFLVLILSNFKMLGEIGFLLGTAMILSSVSSITVLPALLNWIKPKFLDKK